MTSYVNVYREPGPNGPYTFPFLMHKGGRKELENSFSVKIEGRQALAWLSRHFGKEDWGGLGSHITRDPEESLAKASSVIN